MDKLLDYLFWGTNACLITFSILFDLDHWQRRLWPLFHFSTKKLPEKGGGIIVYANLPTKY